MFISGMLGLLVIVTTVLYRASGVFKYYFKMTLYIVLSLLIGCAVVLVSIFRPMDPSNHFVIKRCVHMFLKQAMGVSIKYRGKENFEKADTAILVINHQSSLDMLPMFGLWPDNTVALAKKELLYFSGTFGLGAYLCGTIFIDRSNPQKARKTMEDAANTIKNKKLRVVVFPEGTRNHEGSLLAFKKGAFHLAVQGQVPIIPIVISSYDKFYNKKERRFDEGNVIAEVLEPIPTVGLTSEDVTDLTEKTRDIMLEAFERISADARASK